jgi:predicted DNA-binding transcriptional regulator AlpA
MKDTAIEATQPDSSSQHGWKYSPEEVLTSHQTADELNVTTKTLSRWRQDSSGPKFIRISRNKVGYAYGEIQNWIQARTYQGTHDAYMAELETADAS